MDDMPLSANQKWSQRWNQFHHIWFTLKVTVSNPVLFPKQTKTNRTSWFSYIATIKYITLLLCLLGIVVLNKEKSLKKDALQNKYTPRQESHLYISGTQCSWEMESVYQKCIHDSASVSAMSPDCYVKRKLHKERKKNLYLDAKLYKQSF